MHRYRVTSSAALDRLQLRASKHQNRLRSTQQLVALQVVGVTVVQAPRGQSPEATHYHSGHATASQASDAVRKVYSSHRE